MEFSSSIASSAATSYMTVAEADEYLAERAGFDTASWIDLSDQQKEFRLILAAMIIDSLTYRGKPATKEQNLKFPRLFDGESLYVKDAAGKFMPFTDWESLVDYAGLKDAAPPGIPAVIKHAQAETAFQIVHSHLLTLEPMDDGEAAITSLGIDVISMSFGSLKKSVYALFSKEQFGASAPIKLYLQKYLSAMRGELV